MGLSALLRFPIRAVSRALSDPADAHSLEPEDSQRRTFAPGHHRAILGVVARVADSGG